MELDVSKGNFVENVTIKTRPGDLVIPDPFG